MHLLTASLALITFIMNIRFPCNLSYILFSFSPVNIYSFMSCNIDVSAMLTSSMQLTSLLSCLDPDISLGCGGSPHAAGSTPHHFLPRRTVVAAAQCRLLSCSGRPAPQLRTTACHHSRSRTQPLPPQTAHSKGLTPNQFQTCSGSFFMVWATNVPVLQGAKILSVMRSLEICANSAVVHIGPP